MVTSAIENGFAQIPIRNWTTPSSRKEIGWVSTVRAVRRRPAACPTPLPRIVRLLYARVDAGSIAIGRGPEFCAERSDSYTVRRIGHGIAGTHWGRPLSESWHELFPLRAWQCYRAAPLSMLSRGRS